MSFGALLGGTVTLVGTSPNIIVSRVRQQAPASRSACSTTPRSAWASPRSGLVFLAFAYRLLPQAAARRETLDAALNTNPYMTEGALPADSI